MSTALRQHVDAAGSTSLVITAAYGTTLHRYAEKAGNTLVVIWLSRQWLRQFIVTLLRQCAEKVGNTSVVITAVYGHNATLREYAEMAGNTSGVITAFYGHDAAPVCRKVMVAHLRQSSCAKTKPHALLMRTRCVLVWIHWLNFILKIR